MQASSSTLVLAAANRMPSWHLQFDEGCDSIMAVLLRVGVSRSECVALSSLCVLDTWFNATEIECSQHVLGVMCTSLEAWQDLYEHMAPEYINAA